jgi:hypothetical protein
MPGLDQATDRLLKGPSFACSDERKMGRALLRRLEGDHRNRRARVTLQRLSELPRGDKEYTVHAPFVETMHQVDVEPVVRARVCHHQAVASRLANRFDPANEIELSRNSEIVED